MANKYRLKAGSHTIGVGATRRVFHAGDPKHNIVESEENLALQDPLKWEDLHESNELKEKEEQIRKLEAELAEARAEKQRQQFEQRMELEEEEEEEDMSAEEYAEEATAAQDEDSDEAKESQKRDRVGGRDRNETTARRATLRAEKPRTEKSGGKKVRAGKKSKSKG